MIRRILPVWIVLAALAAVAMAGSVYSRDRAGTSVADDAFVAVGDSAPAPKVMISEGEAARAVWDLPEVQQRAQYLREHGARPFTMISAMPDPAAEPGTAGAFYLVYFGEDDGTHISQVATFSVDAYTGHASAYDVADGPPPGH